MRVARRCTPGIAIAVLVALGIATGGFGRSDASATEPALTADTSVRTVFVTLTLVSADELAGGYTAEVLYDPAVFTPIACKPANLCNPSFEAGVAKVSSFSGSGIVTPADLMYLTLLARGEGAISSGELRVVDMEGNQIEAGTTLVVGSPSFPLGDITCDLAVDTLDVQALLFYFGAQRVVGQCGPHGPDRNLDCDLTVGLGDLLRLLTYIAGVDNAPTCSSG